MAVVCRAQQQQQLKAALASVPALLAASPAFALVSAPTGSCLDRGAGGVEGWHAHIHQPMPSE